MPSRVLIAGKGPEKYRLMAEAVQIDPAAVIERLESIKLTASEYRNMVRVQLVEALARENLDEALAQAESGCGRRHASHMLPGNL